MSGMMRQMLSKIWWINIYNQNWLYFLLSKRLDAFQIIDALDDLKCESKAESNFSVLVEFPIRNSSCKSFALINFLYCAPIFNIRKLTLCFLCALNQIKLRIFKFTWVHSLGIIERQQDIYWQILYLPFW